MCVPSLEWPSPFCVSVRRVVGKKTAKITFIPSPSPDARKITPLISTHNVDFLCLLSHGNTERDGDGAVNLFKNKWVVVAKQNKVIKMLEQVHGARQLVIFLPFYINVRDQYVADAWTGLDIHDMSITRNGWAEHKGARGRVCEIFVRLFSGGVGAVPWLVG